MKSCNLYIYARTNWTEGTVENFRFEKIIYVIHDSLGVEELKSICW